MAAEEGVPVLLVTANVGSIFEEPSVMLKIWTEEFLSTISRLDPKFIALHCQEVGGKNYEQSMRHVEDFVRLLMSSEELRLFDKTKVFLDEDYSSAEHFTALGNFYFIHESLKDVLLWDFKECAFIPVNGKEVHSGNIEAVTTKEKAKFPQDFFPECKWSRKGYLRTRWSVSGTVFDLINIHLFHDASNFIAMETFPSVYSKTRRRALEHTLDRFHNDKYPKAPYFLFGDFNFRTDTAGVIKKLTEDTEERKMSSKGSISKLQFHNKEDDLVLTLGKKEFSHCQHQNVFVKNGGQWLREYDRELEDFDGRLYEFPINFIPSYPFQEDVNAATSYMQTRVPAWCDRVLLSPTAKLLVQNISSPDAVEYGIIGPTTCMGDHKPVFLRVTLSSKAGMISCCSLPRAPEFCFRVPDTYLDLLPMLPDCTNYMSARTLCVDRSSNLLHAVPIKHDPYTPDSMDSPSPNAILASVDGPDVEIDHSNDAGDSALTLQSVHSTSTTRRVDRAVSPALLKSKLELIVKNKKHETYFERESTDAKRTQSSHCRLHSWPGTQTHCLDAEKKRCNSDLSWQRSHVLTKAWVEGKGQQGYHFFNDSNDHSRSNLSASDGELIIPRIAIINASNIESNESSVYLHDSNKCNNCPESKTDVCCNSQVKLASSETLDTMEMQGKAEETSDRSKSQELRDKLIEETTGVTNKMLEESLASKGDDSRDVVSIVRENSSNVTSSRKERTMLEEGKEEQVAANNRNSDIESCSETYEKVVNCQLARQEVCERDPTAGVCGKTGNEVEILRCESKQEMTSKNTTRSNSIRSQDITDNAGNVKLKLKAYKVTQKYKNNIVQRKSRCQRCCCVVS